MSCNERHVYYVGTHTIYVYNILYMGTRVRNIIQLSSLTCPVQVLHGNLRVSDV